MRLVKTATVILFVVSAIETTSAHAQGQGFDAILANTPLGAVTGMTSINPSNFLVEVQSMVNEGNARELASMGKQAARVALHIDELKIGLLQNAFCKSAPVAAQFNKEVKVGCELLNAHAEVNRLAQKGLNIIGP